MKVRLIITYVPTNSILYDEVKDSGNATEMEYNDFIDLLKNPNVNTLELQTGDGSTVVFRKLVLENSIITVKKV